MPTPLVIDISHHQPSPLDFGRVRAAGIIGVIHKATEGTGYKDPDYAMRRKAAKTAGLLWGAYHFGNGASVKSQWDKFLAQADPDDETLLALDYEDNLKSQMKLEQVRDFLGIAYERLGYRIVLYSGNTIKQALGNAVDPSFGAHRLWLASYTRTPKVQKSWEGTGAFLWQFSDKGIVSGIRGNVDVNAGDAAAIRASWAKGNGVVVIDPPGPVSPGKRPVAPTPEVDPLIRDLQAALFVGSFEPGRIDGLWGPKTESSLNRWLRSRQMAAVTMRPTDAMLRLYLGDLAGKAPAAPVRPPQPIPAPPQPEPPRGSPAAGWAALTGLGALIAAGATYFAGLWHF